METKQQEQLQVLRARVAKYKRELELWNKMDKATQEIALESDIMGPKATEMQSLPTAIVILERIIDQLEENH